MELQSSFASDWEKEQRLCVILDTYYSLHLKHYDFKRVTGSRSQFEGLDLLFIHRETKHQHIVDEKAQLDYINKNLSTFAFELAYYKNGKIKQGWLFDTNKRTEFYALVTAINEDADERFTSCTITFVNRQKLISNLATKGISENMLRRYISDPSLPHGRIILPCLNAKKEGYLFHSKDNKAERPLNLILKLDWLITEGIAKKLGE